MAVQPGPGPCQRIFLALTVLGRFIYRALIEFFEGSTLTLYQHLGKWLACGHFKGEGEAFIGFQGTPASVLKGTFLLPGSAFSEWRITGIREKLGAWVIFFRY